MNEQISVYDLIRKYYRHTNFVFWTAITTSGSLIKLKIEEINQVQSLNNYIINMQALTVKDRNTYRDRLNEIRTSNKSHDKKIQEGKTVFDKYVTAMLGHYTSVNKIFAGATENIKWLKPESP